MSQWCLVAATMYPFQSAMLSQVPLPSMPVEARSAGSHPPPPQPQIRPILLSQARPIMRSSSLVGTQPTPSILHPIIFPNETLPGATIANTGNELWDLRDSWVQPSSLPSLQGHWPVCHPDLALLEGTDALPFFPQNLLPRSHVQLQLPRPLYVNTGRSVSMGAMQQHPLWHTSNDFAAGAHSYLESRQGQPQPGFPASRPTTNSEPTPLWCVSSMPSIPTNTWEGLPPASVNQHLLSAHGTYCPPVIAAVPNWQSNILPHTTSHDFGAEHSAALAAMLAPAPIHTVQSSSIVVPTCTLNLSNTNSPMGSGIHSQHGRSPRMPVARQMSLGQLRGGKLEPGSYGFNQVCTRVWCIIKPQTCLDRCLQVVGRQRAGAHSMRVPIQTPCR